MKPGTSLAERSRMIGAYIGHEQEPLLRVEAMVAEPRLLIDFATSVGFKAAFGPEGGYPGLRAPAPLGYVDAIVRALAGPISEVFSLGPIRPVSANCSLSLVTLPADKLVPAQRAPHVDTVDEWQFAILHYLCEPDFGGTAFYRHRATGYETLSKERLATYHNIRAKEGWNAGYVEDGEPWFERIAEVPAEFNSVVVYRSRVLHSGQILAPERLSSDPRRGRLTANIFATFAASASDA